MRRVHEGLAGFLQRGGLGQLLCLLLAALALGDGLLQNIGILDEVILDDRLDRLALHIGEGCSRSRGHLSGSRRLRISVRNAGGQSASEGDGRNKVAKQAH